MWQVSRRKEGGVSFSLACKKRAEGSRERRGEELEWGGLREGGAFCHPRVLSIGLLGALLLAHLLA